MGELFSESDLPELWTNGQMSKFDRLIAWISKQAEQVTKDELRDHVSERTLFTKREIGR